MSTRFLAFIVMILALFAASLAPAHAAKRVALVIGNDDYAQVTKLQKAVNDARAMGAALEGIGFTVLRAKNVSRREMNRQLQLFASRLEAGDEALFFFAGHGVEISGRNYLLPTDIPGASPGQEDFVKAEAVPVDQVLDIMRRRGTRVSILVLDACRDNPFPKSGTRSLGGTRGLARMPAPEGTFIMYSAGVGQTALDRLSDSDPHPNSVFTRSLIPLLEEPGMSLTQTARSVRRKVQKLATSISHNQRPAYYDEVTGDFFFAGRADDAVSTITPAPGPADPVAQAWNIVQNTKTASDLEAFIKRFPDTFYADLARSRLKKLKETQVAVGVYPQQRKPAQPQAKGLPFKSQEKKTTVTFGFNRNDPKKPLMGVRITTLPKGFTTLFKLPVSRAVIVSSVTKDGAADKAGIKPGHVIFSLGGVPTPDAPTLVRRVSAHAPGEEATVDFADLGMTLDDLRQTLGKLAQSSSDGTPAGVLARTLALGIWGEQEKKEALKWYRKAAGKGHADAMVALADIYENGNDVEKDQREAARWYRKAAEKGEAVAMASLGYMYQSGLGVSESAGEAVRWYRKAAEAGNARGMVNLGVMYESGSGVAKDAREAVRLYRKATEAGNARAMANLGFMYEFGSGVSKDKREAVRWYRRAAAKGDGRGMTNLGVMYENGSGVAKDAREAVRLYRGAADAGFARGMVNLGTMYEFGIGVGRDRAEAVKWYRKSADKGNTRAMANLGVMYENGSGIAKDQKEAVRLYRKAADAGYARAMVNLGVMYEFGNGVGKDRVEAVRWYRKGADNGNLRGMVNLGVMYENGSGIAKDVREAVRLYRKASDAGHARGTTNLAYMYERGQGIGIDVREAVRLYRKAAGMGNSRAMYNLSIMYDVGTGTAKDPREAARYLIDAYKARFEAARTALFSEASKWSQGTRREVQRLLSNEGVYSGAIDGDIGPGTRRALEALERN